MNINYQTSRSLQLQPYTWIA